MRGRIERAVVIGPAHFVPVRGIATPSHSAFQTPLGEIPVDRTAIKEIAALTRVISSDEPHAPEHALEVELPFLQAVLGPVPIVPLVAGSARAEHVAGVLNHLWDDETLIVVSSDLFHFHDYDTACRLDAATAEAIEELDEAGIGPDDACGALPVRGMLIEASAAASPSSGWTCETPAMPGAAATASWAMAPEPFTNAEKYAKGRLRFSVPAGSRGGGFAPNGSRQASVC